MSRVVFLGTPELAVPTLRLLDEHHDVLLVVTQPDRPRRRSGTPSPPPVKEEAARSGLAVAQPGTRQELAAVIEGAAPFDVGVVVAFGRILAPEILSTPRSGFLNVHFSLLPRWRGAAPVARALMAGDTITGVTIIKLDEGLDTGPVLTAQAVDVGPDEDAGELTTRLAILGSRLLISVMDDYLTGDLTPVEQSDDGVTYADKISASDRPLEISEPVARAAARVRGLSPTPGATLDIDGDVHKVLMGKPHPASLEVGRWQTVDDVPVVGWSDGGLELIRLQPPGRRPQTGAAWLRGRHRDSGTVS